mgnify:CR=1 FL=1
MGAAIGAADVDYTAADLTSDLAGLGWTIDDVRWLGADNYARLLTDGTSRHGSASVSNRGDRVAFYTTRRNGRDWDVHVASLKEAEMSIRTEASKVYGIVGSPEEAAAMVKQAVIYKPQRIATRLGVFAQVLHAVAPKVAEIVMNSAFRMFPDSAAAKGVKDHQAAASQEQIAFASLMRGIHW